MSICVLYLIIIFFIDSSLKSMEDSSQEGKALVEQWFTNNYYHNHPFYIIKPIRFTLNGETELHFVRFSKKIYQKYYNERKKNFGVQSLRQIAARCFIKNELIPLFNTVDDADTLLAETNAHLKRFPEELCTFVVQNIFTTYKIDGLRKCYRKQQPYSASEFNALDTFEEFIAMQSFENGKFCIVRAGNNLIIVQKTNNDPWIAVKSLTIPHLKVQGTTKHKILFHDGILTTFTQYSCDPQALTSIGQDLSTNKWFLDETKHAGKYLSLLDFQVPLNALCAAIMICKALDITHCESRTKSQLLLTNLMHSNLFKDLPEDYKGQLECLLLKKI